MTVYTAALSGIESARLDVPCRTSPLPFQRLRGGSPASREAPFVSLRYWRPLVDIGCGKERLPLIRSRRRRLQFPSHRRLRSRRQLHRRNSQSSVSMRSSTSLQCVPFRERELSSIVCLPALSFASPIERAIGFRSFTRALGKLALAGLTRRISSRQRRKRLSGSGHRHRTVEALGVSLLHLCSCTRGRALELYARNKIWDSATSTPAQPAATKPSSAAGSSSACDVSRGPSRAMIAESSWTSSCPTLHGITRATGGLRFTLAPTRESTAFPSGSRAAHARSAARRWNRSQAQSCFGTRAVLLDCAYLRCSSSSSTNPGSSGDTS
jgi:hypothetical protein